MFPWKCSPFDQTKPALFPRSVTRPYLLPAGPENFLPIKLVLKTSCTLEAPAQPAASSTPHARNQPLYRLTKAVKYLVQHGEKKPKKCQGALPNTFCFLTPMQNALQSFWGGHQTLMGQPRSVLCREQLILSYLCLTLSSCKLASSGWSEGSC